MPTITKKLRDFTFDEMEDVCDKTLKCKECPFYDKDMLICYRLRPIGSALDREITLEVNE